MILGQDSAVEQFTRAWQRRALHHAWLLAGPKGIGKASFAKAVATRVLADAAGPAVEQPALEVPEDHRIARLVAAGSHPDFRWLERIENPKKPGTLYRDIIVAQVRALHQVFDLSPALSDWRVVVIDTVDELEKSGANALLKMLEEPPANCLFLIVSHAPGRLLPTIRSRCRRLDFQRLGPDVMASILEQRLPEKSAAERQRIAGLAAGSAGRALALAQLDLAAVEESALRIMREGDPTNGRRSGLALEFGKKGASDRYAAFLELLPALVAGEARRLDGTGRERALDAYARTRDLAAIAPRLSLDPSATVFQLGGILAAVAAPLP